VPRACAAGLCLLLLSLVPRASAQELTPDQSTDLAPTSDSALSTADLAALAQPSVVKVVTDEGSGTGFSVPAGVLTAAHVVGSASQVQLVTSDGSTITATVSRTDPSRDLALLSTDQQLPTLEVDLAANQRQGDEVLVLGYPLGIDGQSTLTRGIISAIGLNQSSVDVIQTDAAAAPGDSGAPLLNMGGKVVGLISQGRGLQGFNLAVASETINAFLAGAEPVANSPFQLPDTPRAPSPTPIAKPVTTTSRNWAGYVATDGKFRSVSGNWVIPQAASTNTPSDVSAWVGIGGVNTTDDIAVGAGVDIGLGGLPTYFAWLELSPAAVQVLPLEVHPGDEVSATIAQQAPGSWHISMANRKTGQSTEQTVQYASAMSSAEWIQGLPASKDKAGLTSFDAYNSVSFSNASTVKDGQNRSLNELGPVAVMMTDAAGQLLATPSDVDQTGSGFGIARVVPAPAPAPPSPTFHGSHDSIMVQPGELGSDWTIAERHQEQPNAYSSGKLTLILQQGGSRSSSPVVDAEVEVFKDVPTADAAWQQNQEPDGQSARACDAESFWVRPDSVKVNCRIGNVEILLIGPSLQVDFSALQATVSRARAGLS
jgi:S1-C subfamily serine protease